MAGELSSEAVSITAFIVEFEETLTAGRAKLFFLAY